MKFLLLWTLLFISSVSHAESFEELKIYAEQGDAHAQYLVGSAYSNYYSEYNLEIDYEKSFTWYKKAAEQNHVFAKKRLGDAYMGGLGVEENGKLALEWFISAYGSIDEVRYEDERIFLKRDLPESIGYIYSDGLEPIKKDLRLAIEWFEKSLPYYYDDEFSEIPLITAKAELEGMSFRTYQQIYYAEKGDPEKQLILSGRYMNGTRGLPKDTNKAIEWLTKSAEQSFYPAQVILGKIYLDGSINNLEITQPDPEKAIKWLTLAETSPIPENFNKNNTEWSLTELLPRAREEFKRFSKLEAERFAKLEAERVTAEKIEAERLTKLEAERITAEKIANEKRVSILKGKSKFKKQLAYITIAVVFLFATIGVLSRISGAAFYAPLTALRILRYKRKEVLEINTQYENAIMRYKEQYAIAIEAGETAPMPPAALNSNSGRSSTETLFWSIKIVLVLIPTFFFWGSWQVIGDLALNVSDKLDQIAITVNEGFSKQSKEIRRLMHQQGEILRKGLNGISSGQTDVINSFQERIEQLQTAQDDSIKKLQETQSQQFSDGMRQIRVEQKFNILTFQSQIETLQNEQQQAIENSINVADYVQAKRLEDMKKSLIEISEEKNKSINILLEKVVDKGCEKAGLLKWFTNC